MNEELKTLKDFKKRWNGVDFSWDLIEELKEEAVKWFKKMDTGEWDSLNDFKTRKWIMYFFNLNDEDFKDAF